ncbi:RNA methyltransferase [Paenibacillus sp. P96]|uniref:RNA methyltransferase n=1 Tax=Paenibacillus zeirhizosphaerae TaxID=2987519 RepID=A0ABT9FUG7_9BACL|nr:RNA methyltransferase [Paenibacillus sp. P96]MDP4098391.1 RNA methyltransferase [Paenibacillus sp. P96]
MELISPNNPRVKEWAQLLEKKHRTRQGKYIVEGVHLVQEALRSGADIECIAYDIEKGIPYELRGFAQLPDRKPEWAAVSCAVIAKCTETKTPQAVFAVVRKEARQADELLRQQDGLVIVLDGVQDPGNVGTIIRSADAAGAAGVVLGHGCADLYNPKTIRSTMGSMFHLPIVEAELTQILAAAKTGGARVVSTSLQASYSCYSYDFSQPVWLVIGNEGQGVSDAVATLVDDSILIPMVGQAESLNAAMAATVLLFEAMRQRKF